MDFNLNEMDHGGSRRPSRSSDRGNTANSQSPEKRNWIKQESAALLTKNLMLREKSKEDMFRIRSEQDRLRNQSREMRLQKWVERTKNSPFAVNLVAEDERIAEENKIRQREDRERRESIEKRKEKAKNEILIKALSEFSDLEALRREKRAILEEEQRLKALLALEKVTVHGKADRIVAERALKQRKSAQLDHRRSNYKDSLDKVIEEERVALMKKHSLSPQATSPVFHYTNL
eukprot:gene11544-15463_t